MKALILNSGSGKRMGELTENNHKSMVVLENGETIFSRQLRILKECGINDIVVTTGPFKEQLETAANEFPTINFTFIENPIYMDTNYIYSIYLAKDSLNDDDLISLHGDLVFNKGLLEKVLANSNGSVCVYNEEKVLPEKDFKCRLKNGRLKEVSIHIFDEDCFSFQPLYKLSKVDINKWLDKIEEYVNNNNVKVYAENALNEITDNMNIFPLSYKDDYIDEIDTLEDYDRVKREITEFDNK